MLPDFASTRRITLFCESAIKMLPAESSAMPDTRPSFALLAAPPSPVFPKPLPPATASGGDSGPCGPGDGGPGSVLIAFPTGMVRGTGDVTVSAGIHRNTARLVDLCFRRRASIAAIIAEAVSGNSADNAAGHAA